MSLDLVGLSLVLAALGKIYADVRRGNRETAKVHTLVNGHARKSMRTIARLARSLARVTGNSDDIAAANEAERDLDEKTEQDERAAAQKS